MSLDSCHCVGEPAAATSWQNCADSRCRSVLLADAGAPVVLLVLLLLVLASPVVSSVPSGLVVGGGLPQEVLNSLRTAVAVSAGYFLAAAHREGADPDPRANTTLSIALTSLFGSIQCKDTRQRLLTAHQHSAAPLLCQPETQPTQPPNHLSGGRRWTWGARSRRPWRQLAVVDRHAPGWGSRPRQLPQTHAGRL